MWILVVALFGSTMAQHPEYVQKERTLVVRSLPGHRGTRSNLYEVYMEPYYFAIGVKAVSVLNALTEDGATTQGPKGVLTLEQLPNGVKITGSVTGLTPGLHGFHVHEKGDLRTGCSSAGTHFNPYMTLHGAPGDPLRHVGDLGNIEAKADGTADVDIMDRYITLAGVRGVIGRALVVHEKQDDFGRGNTEDSAKTGSSGARLACGLVAFL